MSHHRRSLAVVVTAALAVSSVAPSLARAGLLDDTAGDLVGGGEATSMSAGAAVIDATWHVGASAGQYASDGTPIHEGAFDPSAHSTRRAPTHGIESRSSVRALVVEGSDGARVAIVANDLYIPQALLNARVATILTDRDSDIAAGSLEGDPTGIGWEELMVGVSHSHSSPYYSTPSWGVWAFQDVFDIRFFEFMAQRTAEAVVAASDALVPAKMGATTVPFDLTQRHSFGPTVADDGTPAGYPETDNDKVVDVVRFDTLAGDPIATWVTFGLHPEMLDGNDLHSGEFVHQMYRVVDRTAGGVTLLSQNNTGTAEPGRDARAQPPEARAEYAHKEYAQMTQAGSLLAGAVLDARDAIAGGEGIGWQMGDVPVAVRSEWFAPPGARPSPTVSSCRTHKAFDANPGVPVVGLPDCFFPAQEAGLDSVVDELPFDTRVTYDLLRQAGIPVPDNTGAPSVTGLQETVAVHLQAIRIGPLGVTVCPCEQWADQSRNIKSRLNQLNDDLWLGYDWTGQSLPAARMDRTDWCIHNSDDTWTCGDPRTQGATDLAPVTDLAYQRMVAQVANDAAGWDDPGNELASEADPTDPAAVWGNYTHEELTDDASFDGYPMVITVGMANDYLGYIATYREFQRGDHYRKALTGLGPHSSDFLATRLSRLAAGLAGYDGGTRRTDKDDLYQAIEPDRVLATARAIGTAAATYTPIYAATLPADGGAPGIVTQPDDIERFDAAQVAWIGGSNWFDVPDVAVDRFDETAGEAGEWVLYGDMTGEIQVLADLPDLAEAGDWRTAGYEWRWVATFEAHASHLALPDLTGAIRAATPEGTYRFRITGTRHLGLGDTETYDLLSDSFAVGPWSGITSTLTVDGGVATVTPGPASIVDYGAPGLRAVGPIDYPDTYTSPFDFIDDQRELRIYPGGHEEQFCFHCSFEPWLDTGDLASVVVTFTSGDGTETPVAATRQPDGTWTVAVPQGSTAHIAAGDATDAHGNRNGTPVPATS